MDLESLFPVAVAAVLRRVPDHELALHPLEAEAVARAVAKRRREFSAGRACAREALAALGVAVDAVPRRADGSPSWPPGVVGSVTHSRVWSAAVVTRSPPALGLGLDIELAGRMSERAARHALNERELALCARHPAGPAAARVLVFSAKESVYKCLHPTVRRFIGFSEAEIALGEDGTFEARLGDALEGELPARARRSGRFLTLDDHVVTGFSLLEP